MFRVHRVALCSIAITAGAACDLLSPSRGVETEWRVEVGPEGGGWQGRPLMTEDRAVGLIGNAVTAFDLRTGTLLWRTVIKSAKGAAQNVVLRDGTLYVADTEGAFAIDLAGGTVTWTFRPETQSDRSEIAVDENAVYLGTRSHRVYALSVDGGEPLWTVDIGPDWEYLGIVTGVSLSGDTAYVSAEQWTSANGATANGHIVALDRRTGQEMWRFVSTAAPINSVAAAVRVVGRLLLAPDFETRGFFAVDRWTSQEVWRVRGQPGLFGPLEAPVERDGVVYGATQGGVYAADLETGTILWKREDLVGARDAVFCGGLLLVQNQTIQVLDPRDGSSIGALLDDSSIDFPTSGYAVLGSTAFVVGNIAAYGLTCDG